MSAPFTASVTTQKFEEHYFKLLVAGITDYAIYLLTPEGQINSWNSGAKRIKGYAADEVLGEHFSMFYTPADRKNGLPEKALQTALREGRFEAEGWRVRKDGTLFRAHVVIDPIYDDAGVFIGYAKVTRDVTERYELRQAERQFRILVQGVTDYALYMLSPDGIVSSWNVGAERIKGYTKEAVVGQHFSQFYTEEDRAAGVPQNALETARRNGRYEAEGWRVRKDGTRFWANVVIDALYEDGALIGFAKITRDISERKAAAEELEKTNIALFQAQKMEAVGQLTGGIAHDFNNLLGVLAGGLDVLARGKLTHTEMRMIESMRRAVARGSSLTQQLLAFARQQPLMPEIADVNALISTFEPVLRRAGSPAIEMEFLLTAKNASISIDAARFEAALLNLIINACDAMPHGGKITVSTRNTLLAEKEVSDLPGGQYVAVYVQDTGVGIAPEIVGRIFEPFFTTKEAGKGTGLGLSQVYGFIAQSGGDIAVQSDLGYGTTFKLFLPISAVQTESVLPKGGPKVLLVEDEPDVLEVSAELVRSLGYDVVTATNGKEAVDKLSRIPDIAVLFTDVGLTTEMNGMQLAQYAQERHPHVKILLSSGYALPTLSTTHMDLGRYPFLHKPYGMDELEAQLDALLSETAGTPYRQKSALPRREQGGFEAA